MDFGVQIVVTVNLTLNRSKNCLRSQPFDFGDELNKVDPYSFKIPFGLYKQLVIILFPLISGLRSAPALSLFFHIQMKNRES